jgi:DNA polymerase-4/DNA polymerase V
MPDLSNKNKVILHIDGDAFFVGVEIAKNPKLKGLPVVTGHERGIVTALSYEAKALGIKRGMPTFRVKKNFPTVVILSGDYKSYLAYSLKMFEIVKRYAYGIEEYSIDECFADMTGLNRTLKKSFIEIAKDIKIDIRNELNISVSIGLAPTKVLAKVASSWNKPDGLTQITEETVESFLSKIPIQKVWGIGPRTAKMLNNNKIETAMDFYKQEEAWVRHHLSKPYEAIWQELHSKSVLHVDEKKKSDYSSIQKTQTFHPSTNDEAFLWSQLCKHTEDACRKARHYELSPRKLSFFLKTSTFKIIEHTITLSSPSNSPEILLNYLLPEFKKLLSKEYLYRTTGITFHELQKNVTIQNDLFGDTTKAKNLELVYKQIDSLEKKFGKSLVHIASTHNLRKGTREGTEVEDVDHDLLFL